MLGNGFESRYVDQGTDYSGPVRSAIIRHSGECGDSLRRGVLYIHGYNDYFFQKEMASRFADSCYSFYAVDLRKYGRSILPGQQMFEVRDMSEYYADIDSALKVMASDGIDSVVLIGHSTGGLTASAYVNDRKPARVKKLILNSPFLDWNMGPLMEKVLIPAASWIGGWIPDISIRQPQDSSYAESLLRSGFGKWEFNTDWKLKHARPVTTGWVHAITSAQKKLQQLKEREKEVLSQQRQLQQQSDCLQKGLDDFREFNLDAHREIAQVTVEWNEEKGHYRELLEAQKNNAEFMALNDRVTELGSQLEKKKAQKGRKLDKKVTLAAETAAKEKEIKECKTREEEAQKRLQEARVSDHSAVETAVQEYDGYLAGENKNGGLMQYENKARVDRRVRELEANINGKQQSYNNRKQEVDRLPIGLGHEAAYQKRRGRIWIDDLQGIQQKLKEQTVTYERIFKREFVLSIYETAQTARSDISDINKELRKLQFSTRYQFDVKLLNDSSDYAKILRYAKYLQETNNMADEGQMTFTSFMGYDNDEVELREKEIKDIINKIIDKNDMAEIKRFADYRNYMSYEIIINNDEVKDGKLSKQVGYNSGAGTQIPYTLILSAALSMLYNVRVNSVRLIFIDEPFEKMSDHNIKLMLEFFKNQDFQVIFCAPPNKLESIGSECGVIIPVLKLSNDNMQIGKVKFHEQQRL